MGVAGRAREVLRIRQAGRGTTSACEDGSLGRMHACTARKDYQMLSTIAVTGATQVSRAKVTTERIRENPVRVAALEGARQRNTILDAMFYDVSVIEPEEAQALAYWLAAEGAILIVPPSGAGMVEVCSSVDDFAHRSGGAIDALAIAGVGSSALGSAAFARNVADAIARPVAAVVSGYGLADLLTEALGGYFWFGGLNQLRHQFEGLDRMTELGLVSAPPNLGATGDSLRRSSRDTQVTLSLLSDPRFAFDVLTGHSKGNLVLAEALYGLVEQRPDLAASLAARAHIVTVSARIAMPNMFRSVFDIIGGIDGFGGLNSRWDIAADRVVPLAWHHTNTEIPFHLPVTKEMRKALS